MQDTQRIAGQLHAGHLEDSRDCSMLDTQRRLHTQDCLHVVDSKGMN